MSFLEREDEGDAGLDEEALNASLIQHVIDRLNEKDVEEENNNQR